MDTTEEQDYERGNDYSNRRVNNMNTAGEQDYEGHNTFTNRQTGISQETQQKNGSSPAPGASHMGVGAARHNSGYRNH